MPRRIHTRLLRTALVSGLVLALALAAAPAASAAGSGCARASAVPGHASKRAMAHATLCLVNVERSKRGLRRLKLSRRLSRAARRHALDMARRNYFSHTSRSGTTFLDRIRRAGYIAGARAWSVGENLAWGAGRSSSPAEAVRMWMASPGHRANVLRPSFRHAGLGIAFDSPVSGVRGATYAMTYGTKR